jgi:hypothetical protein
MLKRRIINSVLWAIGFGILLIIVDAVRGNGINYVSAIAGGIVMGIIEYILLVIADKKADKK